MNNHFENKVKEKMNQLSLEESGLKPNKDAIWNKIAENEVAPPAKRLKFKALVSHAAALLMGVVLAATLLFLGFIKGHENNSTVTLDLPIKDAFHVPTRIDTVFIEKTIVSHQPQNKKVQPHKLKLLKDKSINTDDETNLPLGNKGQIVREQEGKATILTPAKITQGKKEIVYWSDIQNNYPNPAVKEKQNMFAALMSGKGQKNEPAENTPTIAPFIVFEKSFKNN